MKSSKTHHPIAMTLAPRRAATPAVALAALGAAWVLSACGPANGNDAVALTATPLQATAPAQTALAATPHIMTVAERSRRSADAAAVFGEISSIEPIAESPKTAGGGAVIGGVGGAVAGDQIEKSRAEQVVGYRVHVRLDNGGTRSFERSNLNGLDVGARVRIDGNQLSQGLS